MNNFAVKLLIFAEEFKRALISKLFWGRSNIYKVIAQSFFIILSVLTLITGLNTFPTNASIDLSFSDEINGLNDSLHQGSSIQTVLEINAESSGIKTTTHIVKEGETLESIAKNYVVTEDTIRWASRDVMSPFTNRIEVGWKLTIPEINGVIYKVKEGQSLNDIIKETSSGGNTEANLFNIVEFNNLEEPYDLNNIEVLFIPDGNLIATDVDGVLVDIPRGVLTDPLSHPNCSGYSYSRGFTSYHNGVDLALWNGCPIRAVANGIVEYAGWGNGGQGYYVRIDHGGGIKTEYFHGNGEIWVKTGDRVNQDQEILHMGTTGLSTGTHVHFILWKDGIAVDPAPFVPYRRPY